MSGQKLGYKRKKQATKNLERAATAAARKPVYVVERIGKLYHIKDYFQNTPINFKLRSRLLAETLTMAINLNGKVDSLAVKELEYAEKLLQDLLYYRHYLDNNPTGSRAEIMDHRIEVTLDRLRIAESNAVKALNLQIRNYKKDK